MQKTLSLPNLKKIALLVKMSRPAQILAIILVYLFGSLVDWAHDVDIALSAFFFGLVVVLSVIHYANEYADCETDSLSRRTPFSGGSGALPESGLTPGMALKAAWLALLAGSVLGTLGMFLGLLSPTALAILVWGAFWGWMYSRRPLALAWRLG